MKRIEEQKSQQVIKALKKEVVSYKARTKKMSPEAKKHLNYLETLIDAYANSSANIDTFAASDHHAFIAALLEMRKAYHRNANWIMRFRDRRLTNIVRRALTTEQIVETKKFKQHLKSRFVGPKNIRLPFFSVDAARIVLTAMTRHDDHENNIDYREESIKHSKFDYYHLIPILNRINITWVNKDFEEKCIRADRDSDLTGYHSQFNKLLHMLKKAGKIKKPLYEKEKKFSEFVLNLHKLRISFQERVNSVSNNNDLLELQREASNEINMLYLNAPSQLSDTLKNDAILKKIDDLRIQLAGHFETKKNQLSADAQDKQHHEIPHVDVHLTANTIENVMVFGHHHTNDDEKSDAGVSMSDDDNSDDDNSNDEKSSEDSYS